MARKPPTRRRNYGQGHGYYIDGTEAKGRGVTTLIKNGFPSPALMYWAAREVAEAAVDEADVWQALDRRAAVEYLKGRPWSRRDAAAAKGTEVHSLAERLAAGETVEVTDETRGYVDAYLAFREDFTPEEDELVERMIVNRRHRYAGTLDAIATLPGWQVDDGNGATRPARVLYDIKTGKDVYPDVALQLSAYRYAETILDVDGGDEQPMPQVDATAVLHLSDEDYRLVPVRTGPDEFRTFLYVAQVAEARGHSDKFPGPLESTLSDPIRPAQEATP